jgi:hypothetical protein
MPIRRSIQFPTMKARLADCGGAPVPMTPADFGKLITDETERWAKGSSSPGQVLRRKPD